MYEFLHLPKSERDDHGLLEPTANASHNPQRRKKRDAASRKDAAAAAADPPSPDSTIDLLQPLMRFNEMHRGDSPIPNTREPSPLATTAPSPHQAAGPSTPISIDRLGLHHIPGLMNGAIVAQQEPRTIDPRDLALNQPPLDDPVDSQQPSEEAQEDHFSFTVAKAAQPYQALLSRPGQLDDIDQIHEVDRKEVGKSPDPAISAWLKDISHIFWQRVLDLNQDVLPPHAQLRSDVLAQLCRSHIFIHDLWTGHVLHRDLALATGWNEQVPYNLHRLKHWMTEPRRTGNWTETMALKTTSFETLVPWIPRAQLLAFKILLRRGHPDNEWTVDVKGNPVRSDKATANRQMKASQKKLHLLRECGLLYLVEEDASIDPPPSSYWAGFTRQLQAQSVSVWNEETPKNFRAQDKAAKAAYQKKAHAEPSPSPGPQQPVHQQPRFVPLAELDNQADEAPVGSEEPQLADRVQRLEDKVKTLNQYVDFIAEHLSHQPAIVPWPIGQGEARTGQ